MIRVTPHTDDDGCMSLEEIAGVLGLPSQRVRRLEGDALVKMRIGLSILELLGRTRGEVVLVALRGRAIPEWRHALLEARRGVGGLP